MLPDNWASCYSFFEAFKGKKTDSVSSLMDAVVW